MPMVKTAQPFSNRERCLVFGLALVFALLHLVIITCEPQHIFDEGHYVPEANSIVQERELLTPVHPSLGKLLIAGGVYLLGDNPWGWRFFPLIFGAISVALFYLVCRKLAGKHTAFLASVLIVSENLTFTYLGLATLEVFFVTFMLLSFLLYLHNRYALSGVSLALSGLCKMTGLFAIPVILAHWFITRRTQDKHSMAIFLLFVVAAFFLLMPVADFVATGEWLNPFHRVYSMSSSATSVTVQIATPEQLEYMRYPWEWVLNPRGIAARPPVARLQYAEGLTPTIWASIFPSMGFMAYEIVRKRRDPCLFALLWFCGMYFIWIPIQLVTGRITYLFYFLPAVGAVCLATGFALERIMQASAKAKRTLPQLLVLGYFVLHIVLFIVFSPYMVFLVHP